MPSKTGLSSFKNLLPYARGHGPALVAGFVFMLAQNYGMRRVPEAFRHALDEITNLNRLPVVMRALGEAAIFIGVTVVCLYLMRKLIIGVSRKIEYSLRKGLYDRLLELDYEFYQANQTGDLVSRCTNDLDQVRLMLGPGIMYVPNTLGTLFFFTPVLVGLSPILTVLTLAVLAVVVVLIVTVFPRLMPLFRKIQEQTGKIDSRIWQVLSGMTTVKLYANEPVEERRFAELSGEYLKRNMAVTRIREAMWPAFLFLFTLTTLLVLLVGGRQVILDRMTLGQLLQFNVMIGQLGFPILGVGWIMSMLQQGISAMGRINLILDGPVEQRSDWTPLPDGEIRFETRRLTYRYPDQTRDALTDLDLTIEPGELVGITGTIGSGKSTLVALLTGLLRPERGRIFVSGVDIRDIKPAELYRRIGVVSQLPFLFSRTLAENIAMGLRGEPDRDERDRVAEAVRMAGLEPDVATFRDGYDQMLGERGITLSGGQKQRTALARALMGPSPVLVLDDSLSAVDSQTEANILRALRELKSVRTVLVVSHRISPLKGADRILVLDQGRLVEQGSHAALVAQGGLYARLARLQQLEDVVGVHAGGAA